MIVDSRALPTDPVMLSQLPPLAVESMTQIQLTEFIPQLVTLATGRQHPLFGKNQYRPTWWPQDVPWSWPHDQDGRQSDDIDIKPEEIEVEMLRKIVTSCYKHLDQENLLSAASLPPENISCFSPENKSALKPPVTRVLFEHDGNQNAVSSRENQEKNTSVQDSFPEEAAAPGNNPIWVCFLCAQQFSNQPELMVHQDICELEEEERAKTAPPVPVAPPPRPCRVVVRRRRRRFKREVYIPPPKDVFVRQLDLKEKPRGDGEPSTVVKDERVDSDCEIIDVEIPTTPVTPRTPRSLMSQLSRDTDGSHRKRQLSFSGHMVQSDSDSSGELSKDTRPAPAISSLLFNIDISSPLGHRVKKHLKIDTTVPIISRPSIYCRGPEKGNFFEKLRQRDVLYPCTYKSKKKFARYCHRICLTKLQRREFMITLKTGLTRRSRRLLSQMEPCQVTLEHMDPDVVKEWLRPKPRPAIQRYYQQARYAQRMFSKNSGIASDAIQQAIGKPLYGPLSAKIRHMNKSLAKLSRVTASPKSYMITQVVKNPDGSETMQIVYETVPQKPIYRSQAAAAANRRKQNFMSERLARSDEVEIIDLSSSSDDEELVRQEVHRSQKAIHRTNILSKVFRPSGTGTVQGRPSGTFQPRPSGSGLQNRVTQPYVHIPTSMPKGYSIHSSPPGGRTCKELHQSPVVSGGTRIMFSDTPPTNAALKINNVPSHQGQQSAQSTNFARGPGGMQSLLRPARSSPPVNRPVMGRPPGVSPSGPRLPGTNPSVARVPGASPNTVARPGQPLANRMMQGPRPEPVKTSVEKMEVTGKNNDKQVVDVICIDDDDD